MLRSDCRRAPGPRRPLGPGSGRVERVQNHETGWRRAKPWRPKSLGNYPFAYVSSQRRCWSHRFRPHPPRMARTGWCHGPVRSRAPIPSATRPPSPTRNSPSPDPAAGARDQTFRLIVRPDLWGRQARIRLSNAFGTKPVTFDGVYVGLQWGSAALVRGSNRPVTFGGKPFRYRGAREARSGAMRSRCRSQTAGRPRRPPARGELSHRRRQRADDLARQGADHLLCHRARRRRQGRAGGRGGIPLCDRVVVFPRCGRDDRAGRRLCHHGVRRFHHRRHRVDHERRRSLAQRAVAPPEGALWQQGRGGEWRHRRQPDRRTGRVRSRQTVRRRPRLGPAARSRRAVALRHLQPDLARRHQRLQQERQRPDSRSSLP